MHWPKLKEMYDYPGFEYQWTDVPDTLRRIKAACTPYRWEMFVREQCGYRQYCRKYNAWGNLRYIDALMESYHRALCHDYGRAHCYVPRFNEWPIYPSDEWWRPFGNYRTYLASGGRPFWPVEFDVMDNVIKQADAGATS